MRIDHLPTNMSAGFTEEPIYAYYKMQVDNYPIGQFTDGGSILFFLVWLIKRFGCHLVPFICHDIDYRYKRYSKWESDKRLMWRMRKGCGYEGMSDGQRKLAGTWKPAGWITLGITWLYLNTFGFIAWWNHRWQDRQYKKKLLPADESGFTPVLYCEKDEYTLKGFSGIQTMPHVSKEMAMKEWDLITTI